MIQPASSSTRLLLLVAAWLGKSFLLFVAGGFCAVPCAEGAPHHHHSFHANRHQRRRSRGPPPPQPIGRMHHEDDQSSSSYFERHGIVPPPLISRRRAQQAETSNRAEVDDESAAAAEPVFAGTMAPWQATVGEEAEGTAETPDEADARNAEAPSELESIILDAQQGLDDNARLRNDLLWNTHYYDKHSYPWKYAWYNRTGRMTGLPVEIGINFHRIFSVDIVNSVMDLVVWFRMAWVDPRLTWRPEEYGGLNQTLLWVGDGGAGGETSEIWTPDVELWNLETGLKSSLESAYAIVSHDGSVLWSRPGHLSAACKFSGLNLFPFDTLRCAMEFGSWALSGKYLTMEKHNGVGYSIGGSDTAGQSYMEYSLAEHDPVECVKQVYSYVTAPEDDWPVLLYHVTIQRSWQPYVRGYITTQVILNLVGFSAFWLPPSCGERMGLSVTAMLAAVASEIVVAANLPAAAEMTWFSKFNMLSTMFAFVALLECVVVLYLYDKRDGDLVPPWCAFVKKWCLSHNRGEGIKMRTNEEAVRTANDSATNTPGAAIDASRNTSNTLDTAAQEAASQRRSAADSNDSWDEQGLIYEWAEPVSDPIASDGSSRMKLLETGRQASKRSKFLSEYEFLKESSAMVAHRQIIPRDANDYRDDEEAENNTKWKRVASRIDHAARFWIPLGFVLALAIIFAEAS